MSIISNEFINAPQKFDFIKHHYGDEFLDAIANYGKNLTMG